ncbi:MAG: DUF4382 domain-containing protein [Fimbriimonadaceae bacterium]
MCLLLLSGCGGSGGVGAAGAGGNMSLFAIDDMNAGYDHVWVTIDKVDLVGPANATTNLFDATATGGKVVDLRTLHDGGGARFLLLGGCNTPAGTYTGINVTLAPSLTVVPTGATAGIAATFSGATGSTFEMSLTFAAPQNISASNKLVVDFNLANWNLNGTTVSATNNAYLALGSTTGITDPTRHEPSDYDGAASALTGVAPTQTFTLTDGQHSVTVATSASTVITNSDGSANPVLANGSKVDVTGTFDATNNVLDATAIRIHVGADQSHAPLVSGLVTAFDPVANTVTLQLRDCDDFQPSATTITITVDTTTTYFGPTGVTDTHDQFFGALVAGTSKVYATGSLSGATFAASKIQIQGSPSADNELAIHGPSSNANLAGLTFDVTPSQWEGDDSLNNSTVIHVVLTANTKLVNSGGVVDAATFFGSLTAQPNVMVRGTLDTASMTLTATIAANGSSDGFHF